MNIKLTLPDGSKIKRPSGVTAQEILPSLNPNLAGDAVAVQVDGVLMDLTVPLDRDVELAFVTVQSPEGLEILRHSTSHIMACAVGRIFKGVKFGFGPSIENGFYYDFDLPEVISADRLEEIEAEMSRIVAEEMPFTRVEVPAEEAKALMAEAGQSYKVEHIESLDEPVVSVYKTGEFVDLCAGPHIPHTGAARAFKLMSVAGAYWKGDSSNPQLQRIYGTAFPGQQELDEHISRLEEAAKRDHRRIGRDLGLFSIDEEVGPGLVLWHPRGAQIRETIEQYWKDVHRERGYEFVVTPHIARELLYHRSGHLPKYEDMMYAPLEIEGERYRIKPMNCPAHIKIFQSRIRSYRDLPVRYAELGTVYRFEMSGVLHGMIRVRGFTQDDAHIFCTPEQLSAEIEALLGLVEDMLGAFGYQYKAFLATRPEVSLETASDEQWEQATESLRSGLERRGLDYEVDEGGGVFYAPKIDVQLFDALGRGHQGPTVQVDLNLPKRFGVTYVGDDGKEHECVIVHRAILGSLERFVGLLIEHFAGWFPLWLAPEQVRILPITDDQMPYAHSVLDVLKVAGVRASCDERNETMGYKVRAATQDKVPYMLIVGKKEVANGTVSVRSHDGGDEGALLLGDFLPRLDAEIQQKTLPAGF